MRLAPWWRKLGVVKYSSPEHGAARMAAIGPALGAAFSFGCGDILSKLTFRAGAGVLTVSTLRGVIGVAVLFLWLRLTRSSSVISRREKSIALALGIVFAGNIFLLFKAIETIDVAIAILTYFAYPLLTGLAAALLGFEKLGWRGLVTAIIAFLGLAAMLGATPAAFGIAGVLAALAAAVCRVLLLVVTRATLQRANPLVVTFYAMLSSTVVLVAVSLIGVNWQPPATAGGWLALVGLSLAVTSGILGLFASTARIGPFRTALFMNLEPLLAAIGGVAILGEVISPLQVLGGLVMIVALTAFQLRS
jgi:drug/metabolite transporter (DMT)-like permease